MLLFRFMVLLALVVAMVCFMFYAGTGDVRFRRYGWIVLKWAMIAAFGFFAVLIMERMA